MPSGEQLWTHVGAVWAPWTRVGVSESPWTQVGGRLQVTWAQVGEAGMWICSPLDTVVGVLGSPEHTCGGVWVPLDTWGRFSSLQAKGG